MKIIIGDFDESALSDNAIKSINVSEQATQSVHLMRFVRAWDAYDAGKCGDECEDGDLKVLSLYLEVKRARAALEGK